MSRYEVTKKLLTNRAGREYKANKIIINLELHVGQEYYQITINIQRVKHK